MIKKIILSSTASILLLTGCAKKLPPKPISWETLKYKPQLEACSEIDKKYLKTYSFMQTLLYLGNKEGINFTFTPDSEDVMIDNISFRNWTDALYWLDSKKDYSSEVYGYANKNVVKSIKIKKIAPSFLSMLSDSRVTISESGLLNASIGTISFDSNLIEIANEFTQQWDFSNRYNTTARTLNEFYYFAKNENKTHLYFSFDKKSKKLSIKSNPEQISMTPYKMRIYMNYLDANNISYVASQDKKHLYISDDFLLWKKAYNYLHVLNKYKNNIYGVKTDEGYYEISDGKYPAEPLAIELITWTPAGEREYNIYYGGSSRKIITKERDFVFFTHDTHKKFTIRTF